jgi:putative effector of murein hydrolase LrgA (UPF0299 family)
MLHALAAFLLAQLAGETVVRVTSLPLPGPVIGMVLVFMLLAARARLPAALEDTADGILRHLSLLFVPAGVGVVQQLDRLGSEGGRIFLVVLISTVCTLAVTAVVFAGVARLIGDSGGPLDQSAGKSPAPGERR